jgi:hypothetical protein
LSVVLLLSSILPGGSLQLLTAERGATRKHFRAALNPSALGGRGDEL